ncbi:PHB depolymerase family esterase [Maritimibacter sp. DP1N21-5]|uniref:alpha/beta hydrolase family esterase n=1 Tax=Maritimibacter sp. DP1N21-5 TaxID=2836867 RepID=UPI001C45CB26|nr:PHB depolymerase family esterase [Maritimibacter sp. DP1N21-5]MBV7409615.1 hypothetical protein [Maritimibacter sp. DP1N21-5]
MFRFVALFLFVLAGFLARPLSAQVEVESFEIEGRMVESVSPERLELLPAPLVIMLHGARRNSGYMADSIPLEKIATVGGFRAVYIDGSRLTRLYDDNWKGWNAGYCCGAAAAQGIDDLGTLDRIIARFEDAGLVKDGRIYLVGHSNGAMMSYHYACSRPGRIAGVIGISGNYAMRDCPGARNLDVLMIHGDLDNIITVAPSRSPVLGAINTGLDAFSVFMREAGARVAVLRLPNAEHALASVEVNVARETGLGLNTIVGRFVIGAPLFDIAIEEQDIGYRPEIFEPEGSTIAPIEVAPLE